MTDLDSFGRLIHAIEPWRSHLVLVGGWAHRLLRSPAKRAQDLLYIHDTLELFGGALPTLSGVWTKSLAPTLSVKTVKTVEQSADQTFASETDVIREAVRIPQDRTISPERLRAACALALSQILAALSDN